MIASAVLFSILASVAPADFTPVAVPVCNAREFHVLFGSDFRCIATPYGVAISKGDEADKFASALDEGGRSFTKHFAPVGQPIAIVPKSVLTDAQTNYLENSGYSVFGWFSQLDTKGRAAMKANVLKQLTSSFPLPADVAEQKAEEVADRLWSRTDAIPHELSHLWFNRYFDPPATPKSDRYASTAPDWIDETVAVMAESKLVANRELLMRDVVLKDPQQVIPLARFLTMDHPHLAEGLAGRPEPGSPEAKGTFVKVRTRISERGDLTKDATAVFYSQVHAFSEFMIDATGDQHIFGKIASAMRSGSTFEQWLAAESTAHRLPASVDALEAKWQAWLSKKYGQPS